MSLRGTSPWSTESCLTSLTSPPTIWLVSGQRTLSFILYQWNHLLSAELLSTVCSSLCFTWWNCSPYQQIVHVCVLFIRHQHWSLRIIYYCNCRFLFEVLPYQEINWKLFSLFCMFHVGYQQIHCTFFVCVLYLIITGGWFDQSAGGGLHLQTLFWVSTPPSLRWRLSVSRKHFCLQIYCSNHFSF